MKRSSTLLLLVCVFIAGIFVGIWMDWNGFQNSRPRQINYQVQNYPRALLEVHSGDTLSLVPPEGGNPAGLQMNFIGYNPCSNGNNQATCVIDSNTNPGPYFFTCSSSSGSGYTCPDPGIQQSPTIPVPTAGFGEAVKTDFARLVASSPASVEKPAPVKAAGSHVAANAVTAYVSCQNNTTATVLQDLNGNPMTSMTASAGETVFWISSRPFTLDTSKFPANLCKNGNPPGGNVIQAQCDVALAPLTNVPYTVQAQTTPACSALNATITTK